MVGFLDLPGEIRNMIYEHLLIVDEPIDPWPLGQNLLLETAIFYANKTIHRESSSVFYSQNCFDFSETSDEFTCHFVDLIGQDNAGHIQNIRMSFPKISVFDDHVTLDEINARTIAKIQNDCINLRTITIDPWSARVMEINFDIFTGLRVITRAVSLIDTRLRGFSNLERIIVKVSEHAPKDSFMEEMERLGWVICTVASSEDTEDNRHFSDFDDDDFRDEDLSGDDEYDIDNDGDFWRRGAD